MGASVCGGYFNTVSNAYAAICGGENNTASGQDSVISGGGGNFATGAFSSVGGGISNVASGPSSTVPGGDNNSAGGAYGFAAGRRAKVGHDGSFVWGDSTDADISTFGSNQFIARSSGGVVFCSTSSGLAGANVYLAPGGGAWTSLSDRASKENLRIEDGESALAKIAAMPIPSWNYVSQDSSIRHLGPTAQDFHAAFGLGESKTGINSVDIDGVNLLAVQALEKRTAELFRRNEALEQANNDLRARVLALETAIIKTK
jgi:hypothetical protein